MRALQLSILLIASTLCFEVAGAVPPHLVGVWASKEAKFYGSGMIHTGMAVYLRSDGLGVIAGGFPPIGSLIRTEPIGDDMPFACVSVAPVGIRPCVMLLHYQDDKLQIGNRESGEWMTLDKMHASISNELSRELEWSDDEESSGPAKEKARKDIRRLLDLPDFSEILDRVGTVQAFESFVSVYWEYQPNKAFAVSEDGPYGYSASGTVRKEDALRTAIKYCESHRNKRVSSGICKVVNVNNEWVD